MAKKKQKTKGRRYIFIISLAVVCSIVIVSLLSKQQNSQYTKTQTYKVNPSPNVKTYHSDFLDITFTYPKQYELEEKFGEIFLTKNEEQIVINRIGTNKAYNDINEFIDDSFSSNSLTKKVNKKPVVINGLQGVEVFVTYADRPEFDNKAVYLYKNSNSFLSISTKYVSLHKDLEQIANSLHYIPSK